MWLCRKKGREWVDPAHCLRSARNKRAWGRNVIGILGETSFSSKNTAIPMLDELDRWEARIGRWLSAEAYDVRSEFDEMFGFLRDRRRPMIIAVRARCYEERQSVAYSLTKYAADIKPLQCVNYIVARAEKDIAKVPGVVGAWPARPIRLPSEAMRQQPYDASHLVQIGVPQAHKVTKGEGVNVAIIDTGADISHQELAGKIVAGYDFVNDRDGCYDDNGHGTHVAGLVAGTRVGAAPGVSLYVAKALDAQGTGSEAGIGLGIDWAISQGVHLINTSLGSRYPSPLEEELARAASQKGIIWCAAAGNESRGKSYPAAYNGVVSVAAVDADNEHAWFSNIDDTVDVSAPGVDIVSCVPGGYASHSGTSMASPLACGVAALIASTSCSAIEEALESSAQPLGASDTYGAGLVRADKAVCADVHKIYNPRDRRRNPWR